MKTEVSARGPAKPEVAASVSQRAVPAKTPAAAEAKLVSKRPEGDVAGVAGSRAARPGEAAASGGAGGAGNAAPVNKAAEVILPGLPTPIASFTI